MSSSVQRAIQHPCTGGACPPALSCKCSQNGSEGKAAQKQPIPVFQWQDPACYNCPNTVIRVLQFPVTTLPPPFFLKSRKCNSFWAMTYGAPWQQLSCSRDAGDRFYCRTPQRCKEGVWSPLTQRCCIKYLLVLRQNNALLPSSLSWLGLAPAKHSKTCNEELSVRKDLQSVHSGELDENKGGS